MRRLAYRPTMFVVFKPDHVGPGADDKIGELVGHFGRYANAERAAIKAGGARIFAVHRSSSQNKTELRFRRPGGGVGSVHVRELVANQK